MEDDALIAVEELYKSYINNYHWLEKANEISFATEYKGQFSKVLLLACASYFETKICNVILDVLDTKKCKLTYSFITKKALSRQYHTLFNWRDKNANSFFGLFGEDFKKFMIKKVKEDENLNSSIRDFLELGNLRNQLAHDNYALFVLGLTSEEIYDKFTNALSFVISIEPLSKEFQNNE
ncbi:HEPN domain-containing protein [Candidatus Venteria ishoeyi]|uniref:HEPN domain-containing protein n=1 Tax=Candidatus Venteria ishoeyi TaxID=1899563 RepID=UPI0025A6099E|nr:HEPN domain-containing protein [Candidatus Venteria ishoeyi]MDM8546267.1 HEPN domain-containing protein [Candidatus Venteria ishoeyi]